MWSIKCQSAIILEKRKFHKKLLAVIKIFFLLINVLLLKQHFIDFHKMQLLQ